MVVAVVAKNLAEEVDQQILEEIMEKLGVPLDENKVVTRQGVRHCPKCDAQLPRVGPLNCPNCGTEPFESKEEK